VVTTTFTLDPTNPYTHTDGPAADQNGLNISVEKNIIENENETHIKSFFFVLSSIVADSCTITKQRLLSTQKSVNNESSSAFTTREN
jgi:hypothetical protein